MKDTILLSGATGYLGSRLLAALVEEDYPVVIIRRSFDSVESIRSLLDRIHCVESDQGSMESRLASYPIRTFIHCATCYDLPTISHRELLSATLLFPLDVLAALAPTSSITVVNMDSSLPRLTNRYSLGKKNFADWLQFHSSSVRVVNLVLEHFYGPFDGHFVSSIVEKILKRVPSLELTEGLQRRDFIYIDDVVTAIQTVLGSLGPWAPGWTELPIGSGIAVRLRDLVTLIKDLCPGSPSSLRFGALPYRSNEPMESVADLTSLSRLGWRPTVSLENGLRMVIETHRREAGLT